MHTRRFATFLLGAWIAGSVFMAAIWVLTLRAPNLVLTVQHPAVAKMHQQLGDENMTMLLRHAASELRWFLLRRWEQVQIGLGVALALTLFLGTQRRILPLLLCAILLMMVLFQYGMTTELAFRGKETDFPPGSTAIGPTTRFLLLQQVYFGSEVMKCVAAMILTGFLLTFRAGRRRSKEIDMVDDPDHSHVDG